MFLRVLEENLAGSFGVGFHGFAAESDPLGSSFWRFESKVLIKLLDMAPTISERLGETVGRILFQVMYRASSAHVRFLDTSRCRPVALWISALDPKKYKWRRASC